MKNTITKVFAVVALLALVVLPGMAWATDVTFSYSDYTGQGTQSTGSEYTMVKTDVSITNTKFYGNTGYAHFYANGTTTITPDNGVTITQVVLTASATSYNGYQSSGTITASTGSVSGSTSSTIVTWTGSASNAFTITNNKQIRWTSIVVTYTPSGDTPTCVAPTFSPAAGTYSQAQNVTISTTTEGATIYYTLDGTDPTTLSSEYSEALTISETTTVKALAAADGYNNSSVATAIYTISTPLTIAEVREQGTGSVFTQGIVTSCVGTTGYIQDNTAAICVYGSSLIVGDEIIVAGTLSTFNGLLEITSPQVTVLSSGNAVTPTVMTIADINADDYTSSSSIQGLYVTIEEATVTAISGSNTTIAQGSNTIVVRSIPTSVTYAVNDVLTLDGNIGCYNAAQIVNPQNVTVQTSEEPSILVDPTTVNVPCAVAEGTLTVTYQNINEELGAEIYWYESDGETQTTACSWIHPEFDDEYNVNYTIDANTGEARTAYMKIYGIGTDESDVYSELITFSQGHYVADYAALPFTFDGGRADISNTDGLTSNGLGSDYASSPKLKFDSEEDWLVLHIDEAPGVLTFSIKGNGSGSTPWTGVFKVQGSVIGGDSYNDLETYTELSSSTAIKTIDLTDSPNLRYIRWIYTEKEVGNVALGNINLAKPVTNHTINLSSYLIEADAEGDEGELRIVYGNWMTGPDADGLDIQYYDADGNELGENPDWILTEITLNAEEDLVVSYLIDENDGEARSAYFKVYALDDNGEDWVYSDLVTVNQTAAPGFENQYALYGGDLVEGDYIIYYNGKAMNNVVNSGRLQYAEIEPEDNVITTDNAAIVWHIALNDEGYWTIYSAAANAYAASTGAKNKAQMLEDGTDDKAMWTVTEINGTYDFVNKANAADSVNANLRNNGTYGFACYANTTGGALSLYKYTEAVSTYTMEIAGYGDSDGGYYLIASPVLGVTPAADNGFLTDAYDLYYFDQAEEEEWRNYEAKAFNLVSGKGYLYASQEGTTLTFTGAPYSGDGTVTLAKTDNVNFSGWNLVGNPFDQVAYVDRDFYIMNPETGGEIIAGEGNEIAVMQGIFVIATEDGEEMTFSTETPTTGGEKIIMNLSCDRGPVIDRAMIRFGEGLQLPKFMFNEDNTKLYLAESGEEFAVVRSDNDAEMPVNFKAATNGTYTISVNAENVDMEYMHLVDNLTGNDIDLLETPSYTFEASTTDNASRFTLVYGVLTGVNEHNENHFAYYNGSNWTINSNGNATLQVVDLTGRVISSEPLNGNTNININQTAGVYMLRLVNGDNVMTQKVVVK